MIAQSLVMKDMIGIALPSTIASELKDIQLLAAGEHWQPTMPPHITLVYPHRIPLRQLICDVPDYLTEWLPKAAARYRPFPIILEGIHHHIDGEKNVVALKVHDPTGALKNLQRRLRNVTFKRLLDDKPAPRLPLHVTLGNYLPAKAARYLIEMLTKRALSYEITVNELTCWTKGSGEPWWYPIGKIPLQTK